MPHLPDAKYARRKWRSGASDMDLPPDAENKPENFSSNWKVADERLSLASSARWSGTTPAPIQPTSPSASLASNSSSPFYDQDSDEVGVIASDRSPVDMSRHPATSDMTTQQPLRHHEELRDAHPPTPVQFNSISDPDRHTVLLGFRQCAAETLRYLTEVEGLSADDPLVRGLWLHLQAQEQRLNVRDVLERYDDAVRHLVASVGGGDSDSAFQSGDEEDYCSEEEEEEDEGMDEGDAEMYTHDDSRWSLYDHPSDAADSSLMHSLTLLAAGYLPSLGGDVDGRWPGVVTSSSQSNDGGDLPASPSPSL